jgi:hypothetical protein
MTTIFITPTEHTVEINFMVYLVTIRMLIWCHKFSQTNKIFDLR